MFPLAEWIETHAGHRHDLARSGMFGAIPELRPGPADLRRADAGELRRALAEDLGVEARRLFLTHGATEANAAVLQYLARRHRGTRAVARARFPEYGPLTDTARWTGFRLTQSVGPAAVAVISLPRNPEGELWDRERLLAWSAGARALLVDETFREFAGTPSQVDLERPGVWVTGSFTKFYAADELRIGFVVAPEREASRYEVYHDLVFDQVPRYSCAGALRLLERRAEVRRAVESVLSANRTAWSAAFPERPVPVAPVSFDRTDRSGGDALAERCLSASVLVCPGRFFGDPAGVRLCLTRRSFPQDLAAYLRVRDAPGPITRRRAAGA